MATHRDKVQFAVEEIYDYLEMETRNVLGLQKHLIQYYGTKVSAEALLKTEGDFDYRPASWYRHIPATVLFRAMDRLRDRHYVILPETRVYIADQLIQASTLQQLLPIGTRLINEYESRFDFLKGLVRVHHA